MAFFVNLIPKLSWGLIDRKFIYKMAKLSPTDIMVLNFIILLFYDTLYHNIEKDKKIKKIKKYT